MVEIQNAPGRVQLKHRHKTYELEVDGDGTLNLFVDNCLRKDRPYSGREPQYVWTNIELEWGEHHYIEARYWASDGRLLVTVNGDTAFDGKLAE